MFTLDMMPDAVHKNNYLFYDYYFRLSMLARSVFRYKNLPNGIDEKWVERFLFQEGRAMFFNDPKFGFMVAKCAPMGELNYYDEPKELKPYGTDYDGEPLKVGKECVLMRNNDDMLPTSYTLRIYAMRLAEIDRTIEVNINAQKTPILISVSDKNKNSFKQIYKQYTGNEPVIYVDKSLEQDNINVFRTDAPIVFDKLQIQKHAVWNEAMTFIGINNANMDKRERLVDDEVQANNEQIELSANVFLKSRQQFVSEINKMFGLNIEVELRKEILNGEIYDDPDGIDGRPTD